jgi:glycosyltransferase involved in cell wall biosynthesis
MANSTTSLKPSRLQRPIRILHCVSTFEIKTDTKWLHQLIGRLNTDKFQPAIACFYGQGPMQTAFIELGIPAFNLNAPHNVSPAALSRARDCIRRFQPDILHNHLLRAELYGGSAARLAGVPVILNTAYAIGSFRRHKKRRTDNLLDRICYRLATHTLTVSEAVRRDVIQRKLKPADVVHTIHTGIDFNASLPNKSETKRIRRHWQIPPQAPLILTVARLSYEKGVDILLQAAETVAGWHPDAHFVVVGDGPLRNTLEQQVRSANLQQNVHLVGFRADVDHCLAAADLFVMPSLMEGMPNALLEAYRAKLPVIASAAGGLPEAVDHEKTGLLVAPGDPDELASAIRRLLTDKSLRQQLACNGRNWAEQRFSLPVVVRKYEALYEKLCLDQLASRSAAK